MDLRRFEDYKQEVILAYQKQKDEGVLTPNLQRSTPGKLKSECINVFVERYSAKDNPMFTELLQKQNSAEDYFRLLGRCDPAIFRPLNNFLNNRITDPRDITIELLAFLIDFKPRPHMAVDMVKLVQAEKGSSDLPQESEISEEERTSIDDSQSDHKDNEVEIIGDEPSVAQINLQPLLGSSANPGHEKKTVLGIPVKFKKTLLAFFATLIIISASYLIYNHTNHQCMYWQNDHYESMDCFEKIEGVTPVAYDEQTLDNLKKIKDLKTITRADVGKVHYSKENGNVLFYTAGGENPEDHRKRLLPMTEYMYIKYVLKKN